MQPHGPAHRKRPRLQLMSLPNYFSARSPTITRASLTSSSHQEPRNLVHAAKHWDVLKGQGVVQPAVPGLWGRIPVALQSKIQTQKIASGPSCLQDLRPGAPRRDSSCKARGEEQETKAISSRVTFTKQALARLHSVLQTFLFFLLLLFLKIEFTKYQF